MGENFGIGPIFFQKFSFGFLFQVKVWASTSFDFRLAWLPFCLFRESLPFYLFIYLLVSKLKQWFFFFEMLKLKE
jgi:hypothetical protein